MRDLITSTFLTPYHIVPTQNNPFIINPFENIVGKVEKNAGNQHFLLFQYFRPFPTEISIFQSHSFCRLQMLSIWTSLKIWRLVTS